MSLVSTLSNSGTAAYNVVNAATSPTKAATASTTALQHKVHKTLFDIIAEMNSEKVEEDEEDPFTGKKSSSTGGTSQPVVALNVPDATSAPSTAASSEKTASQG